MDKGTLTPRSNTLVEAIRFTGAFGQPDGFGSVLLAEVKQDGRLVLTTTWKMDKDGKEMTWTVELDNEQRKILAELAGRYQPKLYEKVD
jgi:hypothetical protein